jgi:spoIIIJ-associated protein
MNEQRAQLEMIAPTIEEAVEKGLEELGLSEDRVEIEVLDEGSRGLFSIGGRQARVRLTVKGAQPAEGTRPERKAAPRKPQTPASSADIDNAMSIAKATVSELLERMSIQAKVEVGMGEEDETGQQPPIVVDIFGDDLSILIGRRAETLDALQFITRMIVGKEIGRSVHLLVDVENYRVRRERNLRQLAQRMASQALKTGRKQMLEPMPPNERRIIHIELRDNADVVTESTGEEPRRKVTISPV